jgi:hypothetical protein
MLQPPQSNLRQGDIIAKLFFPVIGQVSFDFARMAGNAVGDVLENVSPAGEPPQNVMCLLPVMRQPALIVSQTCDLRLGEYAVVAPLFPLLKRVKIKESEKWRLAKLESYLALFPVYAAPEHGIDEDLVADFRLLVPYSLAVTPRQMTGSKHRLFLLPLAPEALRNRQLRNCSSPTHAEPKSIYPGDAYAGNGEKIRLEVKSAIVPFVPFPLL